MVESFETAEERAERGTVEGHVRTVICAYTTVCSEEGDASCDGTCFEDTCVCRTNDGCYLTPPFGESQFFLDGACL